MKCLFIFVEEVDLYGKPKSESGNDEDDVGDNDDDQLDESHIEEPDESVTSDHEKASTVDESARQKFDHATTDDADGSVRDLLGNDDVEQPISGNIPQKIFQEGCLI